MAMKKRVSSRKRAPPLKKKKKMVIYESIFSKQPKLEKKTSLDVTQKETANLKEKKKEKRKVAQRSK